MQNSDFKSRQTETMMGSLPENVKKTGAKKDVVKPEDTEKCRGRVCSQRGCFEKEKTVSKKKHSESGINN